MFKFAQIWKRFAESATVSKRNPFFWSQLKLTAIFTATMLTVVIIFFQFFYRDLINYSKREFEKVYPSPVVAERLANLDLRIRTVFFRPDPGDVVTLLIVVFLSYLLANRSLRPVKEAIESQRRFLLDASHELRTPLAIIKSELEVALRDKRNQGKQLLLRDRLSLLSNLEEIDRMSRIIDELLLISRIDVNQIKLEIAETDLGVLLKNLARRVSLAEHRTFKVSLEKSRPLMVMADQDKILQALMNIIKNAVTYSDKDIHIKGSVAGSLVEIAVTDHGIGMTPETKARVFERFYRGPHSIHANTGSGLGLSITKWIIESHGGRITLSSRIGRGTTVIIRLPAA